MGKAEAEKLKYAICTAAHKDVEKTLSTIEHRESSLIIQTIQAGWAKSPTAVKYQKYVPNLGQDVKTVKVAIRPSNPVVVSQPALTFPVADVPMTQPVAEPTQPVYQAPTQTQAPIVSEPVAQVPINTV